MTVKPRSVILDLFGDYLRYVDAEVRLSHLTELVGAFDIAPSTVRVTLSRLRREGWFETRREGRETIYVLTPQMLEVLDEGRARIFAPPAETWIGTWTMVIYQMTESERQERNQLRKALAWHGFGPLTTSTWLAPGDRRKEMRSVIDGLTDEQVDVLSARPRDSTTTARWLAAAGIWRRSLESTRGSTTRTGTCYGDPPAGRVPRPWWRAPSSSPPTGTSRSAIRACRRSCGRNRGRGSRRTRRFAPRTRSWVRPLVPT